MKISFKVLLCILICIIFCISSISMYSANEITIDADTKEIKNLIDKYISITMQKYNVDAKVSFDGIIKEDAVFKEYAEKMFSLVNNRYSNFDTLLVEKVEYNIEYNNIDYYDNNTYLVEASVYETKEYQLDNNISYICTEHTFTIEKVDKKFFIVDDITDDYIDRCIRNKKQKTSILDSIDVIIEKDLQYIEDEKLKESVNEVGIDNNVVESSSKTVSTTSYKLNYQDMYDYAKSYNKNSPYKISDRNPNYVNFDNLGGDCTNYVSQIIFAGGAPMDNTGSYQWYYYGSSNRAPAWTAVGSLYTYLINNDYIGPQGYVLTSNAEYQATKGDYIQLDIDYDGVYDHSLWIISHQTATTSLTKIAAHTSDRWDEYLNSMVGTKRWIKLTGYEE